MNMKRNLVGSLVIASIFFAGAASAQPSLLDHELAGTDGETKSLRERMGEADYLVLTFFSATCPCQTLHDPRLRALHEDFGSSGVVLLAVDSEAGSSLERDRQEAAKRFYDFPILSDPDAKLADAVGARFATFTVIVDRSGAIRYRGGIDPDRTRLRGDSPQYVREGLERLLAGSSPDPAETKAFGCYLRRR